MPWTGWSDGAPHQPDTGVACTGRQDPKVLDKGLHERYFFQRPTKDNYLNTQNLRRAHSREHREGDLPSGSPGPPEEFLE